MRKLSLFIAIVFILFSQNDDIKDIRFVYNKVNSYKDTLNIDYYDIGDISTEGWQLIASKLGIMTKLQFKNGYTKIICSFQGQKEDLISEYYYKNNKIRFVFKSYKQYDRLADEIDAQIIKHFEKRYYYSGNELIRLIIDKKLIDVNSVESKLEGLSVRKDSELYYRYDCNPMEF